MDGVILSMIPTTPLEGGHPLDGLNNMRSPSRWSWRWMGSSSRWSRRHYRREAILSMASLISLPRVRPLARCQPCKYAERIANRCVLYVYYHYILLATWLLGGKIPPLRVGFCGLQHLERSSSRWPRRHCWREAILLMASTTTPRERRSSSRWPWRRQRGLPNKYYAKHTYSDTPL